MERKTLCVTAMFLAVASAMTLAPVLGAQEHGTTGQHEGHANHAAVFLGAATHLHQKETGFAIGLEYERRLSSLFSLSVFGEYASSKLERDFIFGAPLEVSPIGGLALWAGPGIEFVSEEDETTGDEHNKTEFLLRLGTGYVFQLGKLTLRPTFNADYAGEHWTLVYGAALGMGF